VYVVLVLAALGVLFVVAAVAAGRGDLMADVNPDRRPVELPDRSLRADDLELLRFGVGFRGYRMDQVDAVLDRLAVELAQRDELIAALEARVAAELKQEAQAQVEAPAGPHEAQRDE